MSLNQIIAPVTPLNIVVGNVTCSSFIDTRTSIKPNCTLAQAGIQSLGSTYSGAANFNFISRSFNDPITNLLCQEIFVQFTSGLLASAEFDVNYLLPAGATVIFCEGTLVKPPSVSTPTAPNLILPGVFNIGAEIINIAFSAGTVQFVAPSSKTCIHFIFSFP